MEISIDHTTEANTTKFENKSVSLWLEQSFRKLRGKPYLQEDVLETVVNRLKADENVLGILLFGSVASGTHTWKSDIDLIFVLKTHEPASGLANLFVDKVAVQYFFTTLKTLNRNLDTVPYLLYMFSDAKILFDRQGTVTPVIHQLEQYFASHPDVAAEWDRFKQLHQIEKKGSVCAQTTIIQRWDELEEKYSGGSRKRTFFIID